MKRHLFFALLLLPLLSFCQNKPKQATAKSNASSAAQRPVSVTDSALLELVQKQTFRYFWDYAHAVSGLARERSNTSFDYGDEVVTIGGSGFGIMAIIVATERKWITRDEADQRLLKIVKFLFKADAF